jgi:hypothetical protein
MNSDTLALCEYGCTRAKLRCNECDAKSDQSHLSSKRRPHIRKQNWLWNEQKFGHESELDAKPRITAGKGPQQCIAMLCCVNLQSSSRSGYWFFKLKAWCQFFRWDKRKNNYKTVNQFSCSRMFLFMLVTLSFIVFRLVQPQYKKKFNNHNTSVGFRWSGLKCRVITCDESST